MDKHTEENPKQSIQKDDAEETSPLTYPEIPGQVTEDTNPDFDSDHVSKEESPLSEYVSSKENPAGDVSVGSGSTVVLQDEVDFENVEATDLSKDEENSPPQSEIKLDTIDNAVSSKSLNPQMESDSSAKVVDVPTHQASVSSISTSSTTSTSLAQISEPIAIPSTSRDSSGLAHEESSPKRPTDFGPNAKQAVHVFHPRDPTSSILQRFPLQIQSGRWVYLRDSPESSDYGGSPDSLDDPFLMEALDINTPENEMEDSDDIPRFEEAPLYSPPLTNPVVIDSPSESGQNEENIEDESSESDHIKTTIEDERSESGYIKTNIGDLPCDSRHIERQFESAHIKVKGNEQSESGHIDEIATYLPSELGYNETLVEDAPSESDHTIMTLGDLPSQIEESISEQYGLGNIVGDESSESGHIKRTTEDLPTGPAIVDSSLENISPECMVVQHEDVGLIIGTDVVERCSGELQFESGHIESLGELHPELLRSEYNVGPLPHEPGYNVRSFEDLESDSGECEKNVGDLSLQSSHIDDDCAGSKADHI